MRSKIKLLLSIFGFLLFSCCIMILTSCNNNDDVCFHQYSDWHIKTNPTCIETGVQERTCFVCGKTDSSAIDVVAHDWTQATCTTPKRCNQCGVTESSSLPHVYDQNIVYDGAMKSAPTCTCAAIYYKSCICGELSTDAVFEYGVSAPHNYACEYVKPEALKAEATCTSIASYYKSCSCGDISSHEEDTFEYGVVAEHTYEEVSLTSATCVLPALQTLRCSCGSEVITETEAALGHSWDSATCLEPRTCTVCFETVGAVLGHTWLDSTCTLPKRCEVCAASVGSALGHNWRDATCTLPKTCSVCFETEGLPIGHSWNGATCTLPISCLICGETSGEPLGHNWVTATCVDPKTCTRCFKTEGNAPQAKVWFHQTWAYEIDSTHAGFNNYNCSQSKMTEMIMSVSNRFCKANNLLIIPVGKVIDTLRHTSEFDRARGGQSLCRDGYHMSFDYGRYAAGATWFQALTGISIVKSAFVPENTDVAKIDVIKSTVESVCGI